MEEVLKNPWVIGIVGGMISGFAVFLMSNVIIRRRERKELRQQIKLANSEVIHSIRPLIVDKELPESGWLDPILSSTAKKYGICKEELYDLNGLTDDIINEIMSNPFLSSRQKVEYCEFVSRLKSNEKAKPHAGVIHPQEAAGYNLFGDRRRRDISLVLGIATFGSVLLGVLSSNLGAGTVTVNKETIKNALWFVAAAIIIPTLYLWFVDFYHDVRELKRVQAEVRKAEAERSPRGRGGVPTG